jgi:GT2 family glycosyltransferase
MKAKGEVVAFIDDDVRPSSKWLEELVNALVTHNDVEGVGGPALISNEDAKGRDLTRFLFGKNSVIKRAIREVYFRLFLENKPFLINHFFKSGTFSLGSMVKTVVEADSTITVVDYLDASNMCFRKAALRKHHGFDSSFLGVGDYSEPDLCFRIRRDGGRLVFNPKARVFHHPSGGGIFDRRSGAYDRLGNFVLFHRRHFQANLRYFLYLFFLSSYFLYKGVSAKDTRWLQGVFGIFWKRQN